MINDHNCYIRNDTGTLEMSLKSAKSRKNVVARAMPVETIITRFKSAQKKKQVEEKKETKKVLQYKNKRKKRDIIVKPKSGVNETSEQSEYYPDKLKREGQNKKVVLKPKHFYKVIGGVKSTNKKKLCVPQKDYSKLRRLSASTDELDKTDQQNKEIEKEKSELSIFEMIKIIEDNGSLNEEDFLEILTCPSPVWWEDPPEDGDYVEESICSKTIGCAENNNSTLSNNLNSNMSDGDKKYVTEETMTNVKEIRSTKLSDNFKHKRRKLEELLSNIKNRTKKDSDSFNDMEIQSNTSSNRENKTSESTDGDLFGIDEEILHDLENMEIPIAKSGNIDDKENKSTVINKSIGSSEPLKHVSFKSAINDKIEEDSNLNPIKNHVGKIKVKSVIELEKSSTGCDNSLKLANLSHMQKDSRFVDPLDIHEKETIVDDIQHNNNSEFITLYKIISDDESLNENIADDKNKMNAYYKQCKNIRKQKTKSDLDTSEINKDSILITDSSDVKYCKKCSSIFDTGHCKYCVKKSKEHLKRVEKIKTEYLNVINITNQQT